MRKILTWMMRPLSSVCPGLLQEYVMLEVDKLLMHGTAIQFQVKENLYGSPPPLYCIVSIKLDIHQQEQTLSLSHLQRAIKCGPSVRYLTTLLLIKILIPPPLSYSSTMKLLLLKNKLV